MFEIQNASQRVSFLLSGSGSGFLSGLFEGGLGLHASEKVEFGVGVADTTNHVFGSKISDESASDGSINLELFDEDASGDAENLRDFLGDLVVPLLIEEHVVVKLILYLDLGPALFLCFSSFRLGGLGTLGSTLALVSG